MTTRNQWDEEVLLSSGGGTSSPSCTRSPIEVGSSGIYLRTRTAGFLHGPPHYELARGDPTSTATLREPRRHIDLRESCQRHARDACLCQR